MKLYQSCYMSLLRHLPINESPLTAKIIFSVSGGITGIMNNLLWCHQTTFTLNWMAQKKPSFPAFGREDHLPLSRKALGTFAKWPPPPTKWKEERARKVPPAAEVIILTTKGVGDKGLQQVKDRRRRIVVREGETAAGQAARWRQTAVKWRPAADQAAQAWQRRAGKRDC